jgi:hypothetical protein
MRRVAAFEPDACARNRPKLSAPATVQSRRTICAPDIDVSPDHVTVMSEPSADPPVGTKM